MWVNALIGRVCIKFIAESVRLVQGHKESYRLSPRSLLPEGSVGKCGSARYSSLSARYLREVRWYRGNFRPEVNWTSGIFYFRPDEKILNKRKHIC